MVATSITSAHAAALTKAVSVDRLTTYRAGAGTTGIDPLALYVWDRDLAAAFLADIAIIEAALRNAMHAALTRRFGRPDWHATDIGLDDRSQAAISTAWTRLRADRRTPGRIVAQLMFGFWRGLLEAGGQAGKGPLLRNCDYEQLWRDGLRTAFPGGRRDAAAGGSRFTRHWTLGIVSDVHALRNRAAHHEPLIDGFPLPGQKDPSGNPIRRTAQDGHDACLHLARIIDRDLADWLRGSTLVPRLLSTRPR